MQQVDARRPGVRKDKGEVEEHRGQREVVTCVFPDFLDCQLRAARRPMQRGMSFCVALVCS